MSEFILGRIKEITKLLREKGDYDSYKMKLLSEFEAGFPSYRLTDYSVDYRENRNVFMQFTLCGEKDAYVELRAIQQPHMWGWFYLVVQLWVTAYYVEATDDAFYYGVLSCYDELARELIGFGIGDLFYKIDLERGTWKCR